MKKLLYILLFVPFALFGQEDDPCFSINDVFTQMEGDNPSITKNFVSGWNMFGCKQISLIIQIKLNHIKDKNERLNKIENIIATTKNK